MTWMLPRLRWIGIVLRRLGDARAATLAVVVLVAATSFLFGVAPRIAEKQAGDALRNTVAAATADTRSLVVRQNGRMGPAGDGLAVIRATGDQFKEQFPANVAQLVPTSFVVCDTPRFIPFGLEYRTLRLRFQDRATDHVTLVDGRFPIGQVSSTPTPEKLPIGSTSLNRPLANDANLTTFEVAVSTATALDLGAKVGDRLALSTDESDKLAGFSKATIAVEIVGIFRTNDPAEDYWFADSSLDRPQVRSLGGDHKVDDMTALAAPGSYPALLGATMLSGLPLSYSWRYPIDMSRLTAHNVAALLPDLRRMESVFLAISRGRLNNALGQIGASGPVTLHTGLAMLIDRYVTSWRAVSQTLSVVETGGAAVALLALGLICLLAGRRRTASTWLWLSRGAGRGQIWLALCTEVALVVVPAAAFGALLALIAVPAAPAEPTSIGSGAVLAAAAALLLWDGRAAARDPGGSGDTTSLAMGPRARAAEGGRGVAALTRGASARRIVLEAAIVAGAIGGAYLLRQRGVGATGSDAAPAGPDLVVAAIPVLIGGAAALVAVRLLPLPLDILSRLAERGRGLVAVLALRRATRRSNDRLLLTVLLTMAAVWSFALASLSQLDRSAAAASWQDVGADYRISLRQGTLPEGFNPKDVPGVEKTAYAAQLQGHVVNQGTQISVLALDVPAYRGVVAGGWPESLMPAGLGEPAAAAGPAAAGPAAAGGQIDVVVSTAFADEGQLGLGQTFRLVLGGSFADMRVAGIEDAFPTLDAGAMWIVADRAGLGSALPEQSLVPSEAFVRASASAGAQLGTSTHYQIPGRAIVTSRYDTESLLRRSAGFSATVFGLAAVTVAVGIYGVLAILAALLLAGAERAGEAVHLHVLGLTRRQGAGLVALEHGPTAVFMIVAGVALGLLLFDFLLPSLGLGSLVGGQVELGLSIEPVQVAVVSVAVLLVVGAAVAIETLAASIIEPVAALRRGLD